MTLSRPFLKTIFPRVLGAVLLVISLAIALLELAICIRILMLPFFLLIGTSKFSRPISVAAWCLLGFGYLAFIVYSTEYHLEHLGKPQSWKLFAKTFGVELAIFGIGFFI